MKMNNGDPDNFGPLWLALEREKAREQIALRKLRQRYFPTPQDDDEKDAAEGDLWA